jgi:DNA-binding transcriptional LysR family regulator
MLENKTGSFLHDSGPQAINLVSIAQALLVAEHASFRQAAGALGVRQSAVSRRIRSLEEMLGVSLFERYHGGVRITAAGARFFDRARSALAQLDHAVKIAGAAGRGENGHLRIGIFSSIAAGFLRDLIWTFREQHPDVALQISELASREHVALIRKGRLDVAFVMGAPVVPNCETAQFWTEQLFVVLPHGHALCAIKEVEWSALRDEPFILRQSDPGPAIEDYVVKRLADLGHRPSMRRYDVGRETSMHLVALGLGVSLTTEATIANFFPEVEFRPITGATDVIAFSAVWSLKNDNPVFRRFLSHARVLAKKWSNRSADVTRSSLARPTMHDSIGRSLAFLALSVQMLGLLT